MSETFNNIGKRILETTGSNSGMMLMFVFVFIVSIYVAFQLYNIVVKTDLQTKVLLQDVLDVNSVNTAMNQVNKNSEGETITLPTLNNGNEYSFSYWIFLNQSNQSQQPKLVMTLGGSTLDSSNIIMYLDPSYNKMHILFKNNDSTATAGQDLNNLSTLHNTPSCKFYKMMIPYVPITRWINITVVVDDNYIQLFMDGELRQVIDTSESFDIQDGTTTTPCGSPTLSQPENNSNFYVGGAPGALKMDGFISKLKFFNYALTIDHAKMVYKTGPVHQSILSKLGLPLYGIRNPFYRVDADVDDADTANN
jgi:hypothetical protein